MTKNRKTGMKSIDRRLYSFAENQRLDDKKRYDPVLKSGLALSQTDSGVHPVMERPSDLSIVSGSDISQVVLSDMRPVKLCEYSNLAVYIKSTLKPSSECQDAVAAYLVNLFLALPYKGLYLPNQSPNRLVRGFTRDQLKAFQQELSVAEVSWSNTKRSVGGFQRKKTFLFNAELEYHPQPYFERDDKFDLIYADNLFINGFNDQELLDDNLYFLKYHLKPKGVLINHPPCDELTMHLDLIGSYGFSTVYQRKD